MIFNKLILFTVESYFSKAMEEGLTSEREHRAIVGAIRGFMTFGRFSKEEAELVIAIGKEPALKAITDTNISFVVFALEILKLWVELVDKKDRPHLNISDKRLKTGRSKFVVSMLKLKTSDPEKYTELREIINDSVITAKKFIMYTHRRLLDEEHNNTQKQMSS